MNPPPRRGLPRLLVMLFGAAVLVGLALLVPLLVRSPEARRIVGYLLIVGGLLAVCWPALQRSGGGK